MTVLLHLYCSGYELASLFAGSFSAALHMCSCHHANPSTVRKTCRSSAKALYILDCSPLARDLASELSVPHQGKVRLLVLGAY